ncbi:hypothetical protein RCR19_38395 [Streptomyces sp. WAC07094]|uniref:hypothetical protein n=1 Tax=Streptomyces sp. WAC07094 TaxID=3072183 RepID=UPI002E9D831B|nr:hypothetical protein [Streptomyces sp. WAC07094]
MKHSPSTPAAVHASQSRANVNAATRLRSANDASSAARRHAYGQPVRSSPPSTRSKAVSFLLLDASVLRKFIGRQVGVGDYLFLAWFITAIAMIGRAFGTSLEGDEKVSDAT